MQARKQVQDKGGHRGQEGGAVAEQQANEKGPRGMLKAQGLGFTVSR